MGKVRTGLGSAFIVAALAGPALAQQPDPYGGVLPNDPVQSDDAVAPPDGAAGDLDAADDGSRRPASAQVGAAQDIVNVDAVDPATASSRQLPVTGGELAMTLLTTGTFMVTGGLVVVTLTRRRADRPQQPP